MIAFSAAAVADLRELREFIAQDNPDQATRVAEAIILSCRKLEDHPMIGRLGVEPGTREIRAAKSWVVIYEMRQAGPYVLRVWHGAQARD